MLAINIYFYLLMISNYEGDVVKLCNIDGVMVCKVTHIYFYKCNGMYGGMVCKCGL